MTALYFDTSALVKRYLSELGSAWVQSMCDPQAGNVISVCDLTLVEFASTIARRVREGTVSQRDTDILTERFITDFKRQYLSISLESRVMIAAHDQVLGSPVPLRSLDAIQLACAIEARLMLDEPITFVTADKHLLEAAKSEGFAAENPNDHP